MQWKSLVTDSLVEIRVLSPGENADDVILDGGMSRLRILLDSWSLDGLLIPNRGSGTTGGSATHPVARGFSGRSVALPADIATIEAGKFSLLPTEVGNVEVKFPTGDDDDFIWAAFPSDRNISKINNLHLPLDDILPNVSISTVGKYRVYSLSRVRSIGFITWCVMLGVGHDQEFITPGNISLTDNIELPRGYYYALMLNLALDLSTQFGKDGLYNKKEVIDNAAKAKMGLKARNIRMANSWRSLITKALLDIGFLQRNIEFPVEGGIDFCFETLRNMLDNWALDPMIVSAKQQHKVLVTDNQKRTYTMGVEEGNDIVRVPFINIRQIYYQIDGGNSFYQLQRASDRRIISSTDIVNNGYPSQYYYERVHPNAELWFNEAFLSGITFIISGTDSLIDADAKIDDTISLPQTYVLAIRTNLSLIFINIYGTTHQYLGNKLMSEAKQSLNQIRAQNYEPNMEYDVGIMNMGNNAFNSSGRRHYNKVLNR